MINQRKNYQSFSEQGPVQLYAKYQHWLNPFCILNDNFSVPQNLFFFFLINTQLTAIFYCYVIGKKVC